MTKVRNLTKKLIIVGYYDDHNQPHSWIVHPDSTIDLGSIVDIYIT